jgi:AcrR family transcriptional regulator
VSREEQKQATGRAILAAARGEFEEVGFDGANLRSIAARAGVSAGSIIHHYGDKRQLLHAALFDDLQETLDGALAAAGAGPLEAQLVRLTEQVLNYYQRQPGLSRTLLKESMFAEEPWAERFAAQVAMVHGAIVALARQAVERGELRDDVDLALFGVAYFSFYYFALLAWVQGAHPNPLPLFERLLTQHLEGLRP